MHHPTTLTLHPPALVTFIIFIHPLHCIHLNVMEASVTEFFGSWLVDWLRGSKEQSALEEELERWTTCNASSTADAADTTTGTSSFGWVVASGVAYQGGNWKTSPEYGYSSHISDSHLSIKVRNLQLMRDDDEDEDADEEDKEHPRSTRLVTFQVWSTTSTSTTAESTILPTCKQVTAWMRNFPDDASTTSSTSTPGWKISHIHETYYIPPKEGEVVPPPTKEQKKIDDVLLLAPWKRRNTTTPVCVPSRRRHLYPQLTAHGGQPLLSFLQQNQQQQQQQQQQQPQQQQQNQNQLDQKEGEQPPSRDHQGPEQPPAVVVGISIAGWDIGTSQGPIGDSQWFDRALQQLEPLSQPSSSTAAAATTTTTSNTPKNRPARRQLALPEMVFPHAYVVLDYRQQHANNDADADDDDDDDDDNSLMLSWNAMDFLKEWAAAHQAIPLPSSSPQGDEIMMEEDDHQESSSSAAAAPMAIDDADEDDSSTTVMLSSRGVSVLETSDASLWKQKSTSPVEVEGESLSATGISSTTFHYDWTYSSPYCGNLQETTAHQSSSSPTTTGTRRWKTLESSGMPMHLLTDRTVPILLFDELVLVEDDLHDNGQMQFTIKVRVMPTCVYVLSQLFVRVDHVLLRVRETRWLVEFDLTEDGTDGTNIIINGKKPQQRSGKRIYRDVTWRECGWKALGAHRLPTNVKAWTQNEYQPQEAAAFAQLLQRLPEVLPPSDIPTHAELVVAGDC